MNVRDLLTMARLPLPELASLTGGRLSLAMLKQLSSGRKQANEEHRAILAEAFREQSKRLTAAARTLDPPKRRSRRTDV